MDLQTLIIGFAVLILKLGVVLAVLLTAAAYLVLFERKFLGRLQIRYGPNRAGPYGLLQPFADTIKTITKEDIVPAKPTGRSSSTPRPWSASPRCSCSPWCPSAPTSPSSATRSRWWSWT